MAKVTNNLNGGMYITAKRSLTSLALFFTLIAFGLINHFVSIYPWALRIYPDTFLPYTFPMVFTFLIVSILGCCTEFVLLFAFQYQVRPLISASLNAFIFIGLGIPGGTLAWMTYTCSDRSGWIYTCPNGFGEPVLQAAAAFVLITCAFHLGLCIVACLDARQIRLEKQRKEMEKRKLGEDLDERSDH